MDKYKLYETGGLVTADIPTDFLHSYEKIPTEIYETAQEAVEVIADAICAGIKASKGLFRLGLTTGATPDTLYIELAKRYTAKEVSFENVEVFTKRCIEGRFESLQSFLAIWRDADRKEVVIGELERAGVSFTDLCEQLDADMDPFDVICHVVYNRPPLTRAERARNVRKRDIFGKYGEVAAKVLDAILDKYASKGIHELETDEDKILSTEPIASYGSPLQIVKNHFGGIANFRKALHELEDEIYREASAV